MNKKTLPKEEIFTQEGKKIVVNLNFYPFQNKFPHLNTRTFFEALWLNLYEET